MTLEHQYARALYDLQLEAPEHSHEHIAGLLQVLKRKGHTKLGARIVTQYEAILEKKDRAARYSDVSAEDERTQSLVELYRVLIATS